MDLIPIDYSVVFEDRWAGAFHYFKIASEMKSSMRLLLAVLVACADRAGVVQGVTIKQLMDLTGMTKKRLLQHLAKLVRQVYLRRFIPDYVGVYSPFKDRTGMYQLNLCHADFSHVGTSQTALVALLPMELAVSADLDAAVFDALDDCSKQYVSRVLQLHVPAHHADNIHFLSNASPVDFRICSFKKYIAKQAQSPAALRLFGQLNEDLVQFLMFKLDQIAFDLMRQLSSGYWVWLTYVEFCNKHPEWTQRFSKDDMDLGELIWGLTQLKAWRYEQLIKFSYSESIFICTPSGFEPPEKYRMGVLTTHTRSRSSNLDARFTVRFQELPPNRTWRTLSDPKQVEQVKRDYGFVTKFGLNDEERARLYSSFMDG